MNFSKDAMGHGFPFVNLQNVFGKNEISAESLDMADASKKQLVDYNLVKGDVLFVRSSVKLEGVGEAVVVTQTLENTTYSGFIIRFRDTFGINIDFKKYLFSTLPVRTQIMAQATNSANKNISQPVLENLAFSLPSEQEQEKIGTFFNQLDTLITLHQGKLSRLKKLKEAFLQQMFPENGEKVPKVRFANFEKEWEQHKLGVITDSFSGGTPKAGKTEYYGGKIPFIRSGEISSDSTELFITEEGLNSSSAKLVERGDILYALYGATSGEVSISRINGAINQAILAIRPIQGDNSYMIVQWLKKQKDTIISTYLQGGQGNLSGSIVKDLVVILPSNKEEQNRCGLFLKKIDDSIFLHQQKLDILSNLKKVLLKKMFI